MPAGARWAHIAHVQGAGTPSRIRVSPRLRIASALLAAGILGACRPGPTAAALDRDNPIRPLTPAPFGMEDFFAEAPRQPHPVRARLGRWLFYDARLSADETVSCATCHRPAHAFSDPFAVSTGVGGQRGRRKAPTIVNLAARTVLVDLPARDQGDWFFWDGRVTGLERQVLAPLADPLEMGLEHPAMLRRLSKLAGYRPYFREAFGSDAVTLDRVAAALADYVRTLRSGNSSYDRWRYGGDGTALSTAAKRGSDVFAFKGRCATCHAGFNFSDGRFHNLGVGWDAATATLEDEGRWRVTRVPRDRGAFKTPGLRDVSRHAPYMHDGSVATLRDVVEFYNRGGNPNPWQSQRVRPLGLTAAELDDLVAFLQALDSPAPADHAPRMFPR